MPQDNKIRLRWCKAIFECLIPKKPGTKINFTIHNMKKNPGRQNSTDVYLTHTNWSGPN